MFGSCKLIFVLLCFVLERNVVKSGPIDEPDEDEPSTDDNKETPKDAEDKKDAHSDSDDKKEEGNDKKDKANDEKEPAGDEKEAAGDEKEAAGDENKAVQLKSKLSPEMSFAMEDPTASLNWPLGIVPYFLDASIFDYIISHNLRMAMDMIESVSCIKFKTLVLMPSEKQDITWINITNPNKVRECVHEPVDGQPGEIVMVLGFDCLKQKQILHTLLHAIGFKDEVTHPLRDQYVRVLWDNIQSKYLTLFREQPNEVVARTFFEYDPASVMHFHDRAFSKNGQATIQPLLPGLQVGPSNTLSALDKLKLRTLFGRECNKRDVIGLQESCKNVIRKNLESSSEDLTVLKGKKEHIKDTTITNN